MIAFFVLAWFLSPGTERSGCRFFAASDTKPVSGLPGTLSAPIAFRQP